MSYGFAFNGRHCREFGIVMRSRRRSLLPAVSDTYLQVPGRDGTYLFSGNLQDREDELECAFKAANLPAKRLKSHEIAAWLHTADRAILTYDDEPDKYYRAKCSTAIDPEEIYRMSKFPLVFNCGAVAYGAEQNVAFAADTVTVSNTGTCATPPRFTATFTAAATEWRVTGPGGYIRVVNAFAIGNTLEVNCATGAVYINGSRAMDKLDWQYSNLDKFALRVGDSPLAVTPAGKSATRVYWTPRYL